MQTDIVAADTGVVAGILSEAEIDLKAQSLDVIAKSRFEIADVQNRDRIFESRWHDENRSSRCLSALAALYVSALGAARIDSALALRGE
ncbi:MAG: hypothetical protein DMF84_03455 [Acidobacteria bacterium]|nr:MAG: hypothetical protein DMF84_03455 [Acidobacteriota bacterium]